MAIIHLSNYNDVKKNKRKILDSHKRRKYINYFLLAFIILENLFLIYGK